MKLTSKKLVDKEWNDIELKRTKQSIREIKQKMQGLKVELSLMEQEERLLFKEKKELANGHKIVGLQW